MNNDMKKLSRNRYGFPLFIVAGLGLAGYMMRRNAGVSQSRFPEVDDRVRKALKDEDQKLSDFPKQVDLEPAFE